MGYKPRERRVMRELRGDVRRTSRSRWEQMALAFERLAQVWNAVADDRILRGDGRSTPAGLLSRVMPVKLGA